MEEKDLFIFKNLGETSHLMSSEDYQERFKAEYVQLLMRTEKLENMLIKWNAGLLDFEPATPRNVLQLQLNYMKGYLGQLKIRAEIEGIDIDFVVYTDSKINKDKTAEPVVKEI